MGRQDEKGRKGNSTALQSPTCSARIPQKFGIDFYEVSAPVSRQTTFRTILSVSGKRGLIIHHLDAKTAFLNGTLKETIYMKQPPGFNFESLGKVCLLKKSLYGLKQAARVGHEKVNDVLINGGSIQGKADPYLYSKRIGDD